MIGRKIFRKVKSNVFPMVKKLRQATKRILQREKTALAVKLARGDQG
jgi:hypothetical protein